MKAREATSLLIVLSFLFIVPSSTANMSEWDYSNYLYYLDIISYEDPVVAGQPNQIAVEVGANTEVVLHVELKGEFPWGHWTFSSCDVQVEEGLNTVTCDVNVPYKTIIEPASSFYYYIYVTLPGDPWGSSTWGLAQTVTLEPPSEVSHEELVACMSQLKWLVDTSDLSEGIKQSLLSELKDAGDKIDSAYESGEMNKLLGATGSLNAFINELQTNNEAASHPDLETWKEQAEFIIERLETIIS
jgi:hypothetical protein